MSGTLEDSDQCEREEFLGFFTESGTARQSESEFATGGSFDLAHDDGIDELGETGDTGFLHGQSTTKDFLLERSALVDLGHNTLSNHLPDRRNTDHQGRLERSDVTETFTNRLVGEGLDASEPECDTDKGHAEFDDEFENVRERQVGEVAIPRTEV